MNYNTLLVDEITHDDFFFLCSKRKHSTKQFFLSFENLNDIFSLHLSAIKDQ